MGRYLSIVFVLSAVTLLILLPGCDSSIVDFDKNDLASVNLKEGIHRKEVSLGKPGTLRYTVAVPRLITGKKVPLVIALHGSGKFITPYFSEAYLQGLVEPALRDLGAIIVAPDMPGSSWLDQISEEVVTEFISEVLKLTRSWPIDPEKVVITGYSAGGFGTWFFTEKHPDLFSAGIPMAASPMIGDRSGPNAVPLFVIHGSQDEFFSYDEVLSDMDVLRSLDVKVEFVTAENLSHTSIYAYVPALRGAISWLENEIWIDELPQQTEARRTKVVVSMPTRTKFTLNGQSEVENSY